MRRLLPIEIEVVYRLSTIPKVQVGLFEVTETQLIKSIVDATFAMRDSLARTGFHDFDSQRKGPDHKVERAIAVFSGVRANHSRISLYRPETKNGDPRFWIHGLKTLMNEIRPTHVLAVLQDGNAAAVVNVSMPACALDELGNAVGTFFRIQQLDAIAASDAHEQVFDSTKSITDDDQEKSAERLLAEFLELKFKGPIPAIKKGPTAIGHAIETALGIDQNSSRDPDKYGIEIKASRSHGSNRVNLFAQVANWRISEIKSSAAMLRAYGYTDPRGVPALRCTVSATGPNSQGLYFDVNLDESLLLEKAITPSGEVPVLAWSLDQLGRRLAEKHKQTFWVDAEEVTIAGLTHFDLTRLVYTRSPNLTALGVMLADGTVTMDHLISHKPGKAVTEKGPLFKIWPQDIPKLFTVEAEYDLN